MASTYLGKAEAWDEVTFTAGGQTWYCSGDLGRLDDEGFLYIVDRAKDMVISGGENVYSVEVERTLLTLPGVADACVVGVADERWGESVTAVIVREPSSQVTAEEVIAGRATQLAAYKRPRHVCFTDSLPRNAFGKVRKDRVRGLAADLERAAAAPGNA
jgi:fatty-acyl-CoA synthase